MEKRLDNILFEKSQPVLNGEKKSVDIDLVINNECRAFASTLSYHISMKYDGGLPENSINITLRGSAGQSFCAFLVKGIRVTLEGDANDYVGKVSRMVFRKEIVRVAFLQTFNRQGLSGGEVIIYPPKSSTFESHKNVIAGNVCLYGATNGKAFFRGIAAERFCVRNSGVVTVVEVSLAKFQSK